MVRLSVNINKVATLRNSRGGTVPDLCEAVQACLDAGCRGITVHPRQDERHIRAADVDVVADYLAPHRDSVEYNIEGDPRPELMARVQRLKPHQCTLVPVLPGELTSQAGWPADTPKEKLAELIGELKALGIRTAVFVDAEAEPIEWAASIGADRVELYTEPYARAFLDSSAAAKASYATYAECAQRAHDLGLGINAGHDLDLDNLVLFRELPHLDEVSIGHALISRAVFVGLQTVVGEYLALLER